MEIKVTKELNAKFDERYEIVSESGCWIWTGSLGSHPTHRYGNLSIGKSTNYKAHRYAAVRFLNANLTSKTFVCHTCDVTECVNPDHLYVGSAATNAADRDSRKRNTYLYGEDHNMCKISERDAKDIFLQEGKHKDIADQYGIARPTVTAIKTGRLWRHATKHLGGCIRPPRNKITAKEAQEIFCKNGTHSEIAKEYGISRTSVSLIKAGKNWRQATKNLRESVNA